MLDPLFILYKYYTKFFTKNQLVDYTNSGENLCASLCDFSLDKLCGLWYNKNSAPHVRGRRDHTTKREFCQEVKAYKK